MVEMSSKNDETEISDSDSIVYESTKNIEIHHPLPLWRRLAFGVGGIPMQLMQNISGFFLTLFLLEVVDIPPEYISAVLLVSRVVDAFTDPIMGYLVLKTRSRFGQKRPWMIFSTPTWVLSFFFLYYAIDASPMAKLAIYLILNCLLQIGLTAYHVPYSSMTMVLTTDPKERDVLTAFRKFLNSFNLSYTATGLI
nr:major facilitator superfamily domain containing protein [Hymenolepis microstoma]